MNVKKNPFYYINTVIFLVLTVYSLLVCINVFDMDNIDMNAGLCAVIVSMVLCLVMYLIHAMNVRNMLAANPILKTSLEVISVLIFLTLSCVVRVYMMGEFELDLMREGIVLLCMFMAYLTARMLNQFGFVTLMCLVPWPYLISTYNYDLQELIQMAAVIAGICVLSVIIFAVRKNPSLKLTAMVMFLIVVAAYFFYEMYQAGLRSIYMEDYKKYIECFNKMFEFTQFERFYFIALVMAAIIGGIRLFLGAGSANTLILYVVNVLCCFTITFDLGPMYLQFMYPLLAMAAAGSLGTRPAHEDQEVQLRDNLENVKVKYNKKDVVGLNYVDDSELDKMLADIEKDQRYISHKNLSASSQEDDNEEVPVELSMYDSALSRPDEDNANEKTVSAPQPMAAPVYEPVASTPVYEPVRPVTPAPEPIAPAPVYETVRPAAPVQEPSIPAPAYEAIMATPAYETIEKQTEVFSYEPQYQYEEQKPSYEPQYQYEEQKPSYEPEYRYEEEQTVTKPQVSYYEPEPVIKEEPTIEPVVMPVYPTMEEKAEEPKQPEVSSYEPEYNYEEQKPSYEPEYHYEEQKPSYEPEYNYEEEKSSYEPEYHYEEEQTVTEPEPQVSYYEPEPVMKEESTIEPVVMPVYPTMEEKAEEPKQPEVSSYEPEYNYEEEKPSYEPEYNYEEEKPSYEPEYHYEEEQTVTEPKPQVSYYEPEPVTEEPAIEPVVMPVYPTMEEKAEEPKQPEVSSYEPEYNYEEEKPSYEPEYNYEEEKTSYEPEYHYEEEQLVTEPEPQVSYHEPEPVTEEPAVELSQPEPVAPSYETVSFKEPVYETLVKEEPQNLEPHVLIKNLVSFENEKGSEMSQTNEDNGIGQSKPMFETMASFFSNNLDIDNAPKFEMSQQDAQSFSAYSAANEIYTPIDSLDELFTNVDAGLEFEEADGKKQPYNEDDELVEEPVSIHKDNFDDFSDGIAPVVLDRQKDDEDEFVTAPDINQAVPQQEVTMPESIELGIDLEEDFGFGQTQSFTDFYDTDHTPVFAGFEEVQEVASPEFAVQMPETEFVSKQYEETVKMDVPVMESPVIEAPVMEEMTIPEAIAPIMEEMTVPEAAEPIMEEIVIPEPVKEPEFAKVPEEIVTEQTFVQPAVENYAEDIPVQPEPEVEDIPVQPVSAVEEIPEPPAAPKKEEEPVKQINPFAKEADFFDWSTYDGSVEEEQEQVAETAENEPVKPQESNGFEEFVWTDEMIKQYAEGPKETTPQPEAVTEVIQEIAATAVPEQAFEPVVNVSAKIPPVQPVQTEIPPVQIEVQPVQIEIPTVQKMQTEIPVQPVQTAIPVPQPEPVTQRPVYPESVAQEEETPQYQVFQSSGNFRIEEPEENEEEVPQYQVFQSSGNFRIEEPEEEAEEAPQYQVYQSSGNFRLEEPEEEVEPTLITYGGPQQQKTEPVTTKPATAKPASGQRFDDFEFDLDLPDFEPFDATKR